MIAGLILAAGESRRMGRDKALLTYRGHTFLETIITTLREAGVERIAVVLGHHAEEIQRTIRLDSVEVVINPDWQRGQTSSLQAGLRALESPDLEALLLCLVDHPAVSPETIRRLRDNFNAHHAVVVIPTFQNQRGHPVVIVRALFPELLDLSVDEGANRVIRDYSHATEFLEVDDPGIVLDVDNEQTYMRLQGQ
jgi:molybdenum cofactor cytidylyltransferase